jgi:hypothetical protein
MITTLTHGQTTKNAIKTCTLQQCLSFHCVFLVGQFKKEEGEAIKTLRLNFGILWLFFSVQDQVLSCTSRVKKIDQIMFYVKLHCM